MGLVAAAELASCTGPHDVAVREAALKAAVPLPARVVVETAVPVVGTLGVIEPVQGNAAVVGTTPPLGTDVHLTEPLVAVRNEVAVPTLLAGFATDAVNPACAEPLAKVITPATTLTATRAPQRDLRRTDMISNLRVGWIRKRRTKGEACLREDPDRHSSRKQHQAEP